MCRRSCRGTRRFTLAWCTVVERSPNDVKFRVLVMYRSLHVSVSHGHHDGGEISRSREKPRSVVVARTVQDEIFREYRFIPRFPKQVADRPEVPGSGTL